MRTGPRSREPVPSVAGRDEPREHAEGEDEAARGRARPREPQPDRPLNDKLHDRAVGLHEQAAGALDAGDARLALCLASRALGLLARAVPAHHPDVANVELLRAQALDALDRGDEALVALTRARRIVARPTREPDVLRLRVQVLCALGFHLTMRGGYAKARTVLGSALTQAERHLGPRDEDSANVLNCLGVLGKYTARFADAARAYRRALGILSRLHGEDSPVLASLYHNLGGLEHARGRFRAGIPHARRSIVLRRKTLPASHPTVVADEAALAALLEGAGELSEAERLYRRAIRSFTRVYGERSYEVAVNQANLAGVRADRGHHAEAERLYRRALATHLALGGEAHPDVALARHNLGVLLADLDRPAEARALLEVALRAWRRLLPASHPKPRATRAVLARLSS